VQDEIPGLGPRTERPRINTAADLSHQNLSPTEGFVLSRVDGQTSYEDICKVTGLGREQTLDILRGLRQSKLILGPTERVVGVRKPLRPATPKPEPRSESKAPAAEPAPEPVSRPIVPPAPSAGVGDAKSDLPRPKPNPAVARSLGPLERLDDGTPVPIGELTDWPDADPLLKERIIRLHRRMKKLSPFELLGVAPTADAGAIRRAFAVASKDLHPDRYFGKNLGSFKGKLAAIFARLAEAMQEIESGQKGKR